MRHKNKCCKDHNKSFSAHLILFCDGTITITPNLLVTIIANWGYRVEEDSLVITIDSLAESLGKQSSSTKNRFAISVRGNILCKFIWISECSD